MDNAIRKFVEKFAEPERKAFETKYKKAMTVMEVAWFESMRRR